MLPIRRWVKSFESIRSNRLECNGHAISKACGQQDKEESDYKNINQTNN